MSAAPHDPCAGCVYYVKSGEYWLCDYLLRTGHRRPCPFGAGCTAKQTEEGNHLKKWDKATALKLWEEGKTDPEIAEAVGVALNTVYQWRRKENLRPNFGPNAAKRPRAPVETVLPEAETVDAPAGGEPEEPRPATAHVVAASGGNDHLGSLTAAPVELRLELGGGWVRLRAPSWEQAVRLWRILNVCVEALGADGGG